MTIREALEKALDEWKSEPDFDFNAKLFWLDEHMSDVVTDWAVENGWDFDDDNCIWVKKETADGNQPS